MSKQEMERIWIAAGMPRLIGKGGHPTTWAISAGRVPLLGVPAKIKPELGR